MELPICVGSKHCDAFDKAGAAVPEQVDQQLQQHQQQNPSGERCLLGAKKC